MTPKSEVLEILLETFIILPTDEKFNYTNVNVTAFY